MLLVRRQQWGYLIVVGVLFALNAACSAAVTGTATPATAAGTQLPGTIPSTKASFIQSANAICAATRATPTTLPRQTTPGASTLAPVASIFEQWAAGLQRSLTQMQALAQPPGDDAALRDVYTDMSDLHAAGTRLVAAARKEDLDQTAELWADLDGQEAKFDAAATSYGLTDCATHTPGPH